MSGIILVVAVPGTVQEKPKYSMSNLKMAREAPVRGPLHHST